MALVSALDGNNPIAVPDCPQFGCRIPFDGEYLITQGFRNPQYTSNGIFYHRGTDLIKRDGTIAGAPLLATANGQVVNINDIHYSYGNHVRIYHGLYADEDGTVRAIYSLYAHLSVDNVYVGQIVKQGDVIGWADNTGLSTGSHLHWELRYGEIRVAALSFVRVIAPPPPPPPPDPWEEFMASLDEETKTALLFLAQHKDDVVFLGDKSLLLAMYGPYGTAPAAEKERMKRKLGRLVESMGEPLVGEPTNVLQRLNKTLSLPNGGTTDGEGIPAPEDDGQDE